MGGSAGVARVSPVREVLATHAGMLVWFLRGGDARRKRRLVEEESKTLK